MLGDNCRFRRRKRKEKEGREKDKIKIMLVFANIAIQSMLRRQINAIGAKEIL